jgi:hypothetical protein
VEDELAVAAWPVRVECGTIWFAGFIIVADACYEPGAYGRPRLSGDQHRQLFVARTDGGPSDGPRRGAWGVGPAWPVSRAGVSVDPRKVQSITEWATVPATPKSAQASFDALKPALSSAPVLRTFDPARRAVLTTDARNIAIAAILTRPDDDGRQHPVAYKSRKLTAAERNYPAHVLALLTVVHSLRVFRH